jgi:hypothetical protein
MHFALAPRCSRATVAALTALALALLAPGAEADLPRSFTEDFSTKQYCGVYSTTATWDTVAGEIRLPPFQLDYLDGYDTPGDAKSVAVRDHRDSGGHYVYLADGSSGLLVFQLSGGGNLQLCGQADTPGSAWDVEIWGDYAYVGDSSYGLQVVDISNPWSPSVVGGYNTSGLGRGLAVDGDYVVLADDASGVRIFDISDPVTPALLGTYVTPADAMDVALAGDLVYVAARGSGLIVIDISNPSSPSYVGSYDTAGDCWGVAVDGDHAYLGDATNGFLVVDVTDPSAPALVGSYNTSSSARAVTVDGDFAYVADYGYTYVFDISNPASPTVVYAILTPGVASVTAVEGDVLYVAAGVNGGLLALRHQALTGPFATSTVSLPGYGYSLALHGDYAYVANGSAGLAVVDIHDLEALAFVRADATYTSGASAKAVAVAGNHLYVADASVSAPGLYTFDITDPTSPLAVDYDPVTGEPNALAIAGARLYMTVEGWPDSMFVFNISHPASPSLWGGFDRPDILFNAIAVEGDYAYVHDGASEFLIIDVTNPALPVQEVVFPLPSSGGGSGEGIAIAGDYALLAFGWAGLHIVDISNPASPALVATCDALDWVNDVVVRGDYAFVVDYPSEVRVIDVSDPAYPELLDPVQTMAAGPTHIAAAGDHLFVTQTNPNRFSALEAFQRVLDTAANHAGSTTFSEPAYDVVRAAFTDTPATGLTWELSATEGTYWSSMGSGSGAYYRVEQPGKKLRWRSTLTMTGRGVNPTCGNVRIDWLYDFAMIDSIVDVPGDEGGWARVHFTRSGRDFADEPTYPVTGYSVYRRVDDPVLRAEVIALAASSPGDGKFVVSAGAASSSLPPGVWESVAYVAAHQENDYVCLVPTLADSSGTPAYSVFCVTAQTTTPSVYYVSLPDSGFSVDNLPPPAPSGFTVVYRPYSNLLTWGACVEEECPIYNVYRGDTPDFEIGPGSLVASTGETMWVDAAGAGYGSYYKVTAEDGSGNESAAASPENVAGVRDGGLPTRTFLYRNAPNPANPLTRIAFDLPTRQAVSLEIFGLDGRLVATLAEGELPAGRHEVAWRGLDSAGQPVAPGAYFYRLQADTFSQTRRLLLIR